MDFILKGNATADTNKVINTIKQLTKDVESFIQKNSYPEFELGKIILDYSPKRTYHRGGMYAGKPGINMAVQKLRAWATTKQPIMRLYEYKSFDDDKEIGGFYTYNGMDFTTCFVVHELSHSLQWWLADKGIVEKDRPHGDSFKIPYRMLRNEFVNHTRPNQAKAKVEYEDFLKQIGYRN